MPFTDPRRIELMAIAEARRLKMLGEGDAQMKQQVKDLVADIEAQGTGATKDLLDDLKKDPNWLGGSCATSDARRAALGNPARSRQS